MKAKPRSLAWATDTFSSANFGDIRLRKRLIDVASRQADAPEASTHAVCGGDSALVEASYRFYGNEYVSASAIGNSGFNQTATKCGLRKQVLVIEDATTLNYSHLDPEEVGTIGGAHNLARGFCVQTALAVDGMTGEILGLIGQEMWTRVDTQEPKKNYKKVPYEDKESFIWQKMSASIATRLPTMNNVLAVCDRGADIHEYLHYKIARGERFVVRGSHDRCIKGQPDSLFALANSWPVQGEKLVSIAQRGAWKNRSGVRPARQARIAYLDVRFGSVTFIGNSKNKYLHPAREEVTLNVVHVTERDALPGETPLTWTLLTSESVETLEDALRIVNVYEKRWLIEDFHKAWKSGCNVEKRRFDNPDDLKKIATILAFIAVRLLQLRTLQDIEPTASAATVLTTAEWKCLWRGSNPDGKLPRKPPTLDWALKEIGYLAGWRPTAANKTIGWASLWKGWMKLQDRAEGWLLFEANSAQA